MSKSIKPGSQDPAISFWVSPIIRKREIVLTAETRDAILFLERNCIHRHIDTLLRLDIFNKQAGLYTEQHTGVFVRDIFCCVHGLEGRIPEKITGRVRCIKSSVSGLFAGSVEKIRSISPHTAKFEKSGQKWGIIWV